MTTEAHRILSIVRADNARWTAGREVDGPEPMYAEDAVLIAPGFARRVEGSEAIRATYAEFLEAADVISFAEHDLQVDVRGSTAVATYGYSIEYEMDGERHAETGRELLVFARTDAGWRVVWRTQLGDGPEPSASSGRDG